MNNKIRTDLALEVRESFPQDDVEIRGVILEEEYDEAHDIRVSIVEIKDEKGLRLCKSPLAPIYHRSSKA